MEFGNPIVGQEELIREAIKSRNFTSDPENGVSGWRIARDGSATFYNLTVGSDSYFIDENGNAVFSSVSADSITLNGEPLTESLSRIPDGVVVINQVNHNSDPYNGTEIIIGRLIIPEFDVNQEYEIGCNFHIDMQSTVQGYVKVNVRYRWDADPTTSSSILTGFDYQSATNPDTSYDQWINFSYPFHFDTVGGTSLHISFGLTAQVASTTGARLQAEASNKVWAKHLGPKVTYGDFDPGVSVSPPTKYTKTYSANGSTSHQGDGDNRNITECYQGYYSSTNGNQWSIITFPYATIQSDLAGATIDKVELYLNNQHWYNNSGGTAVIGTHEYSVTDGHSNLSDLNTDRERESFSYGEAKWVTLSNSFGNDFRDDRARGIVLGPGPSTSKTYYGYFAGNGQTGEPKLRITYTK